MADAEQLAQIRRGGAAWNAWYSSQSTSTSPMTVVLPPKIDLSGADLSGLNLANAYLRRASLAGADLRGTELRGANLRGADLRAADMRGGSLEEAILRYARLDNANLADANLNGVNCWKASLPGANLTRARLIGATLRQADLSSASLRGADLREAVLTSATLASADLDGANLSAALMIGTDLRHASLSGCRVYGIAAWDLKTDETTLQDLIITAPDEPTIRVGDVEVAQFVNLIRRNATLRRVIETVTGRAVLILGRFTPERKSILDALHAALAERGYVPILFDFTPPDTQDLTGTVSLLARLSRFIVVDLTDPNSVPYEVGLIAPHVFAPIMPLLATGNAFPMFADLRKRYHWVLPEYVYSTQDSLLQVLDAAVIEPAEAKLREMQGRPMP